MAGKGLRLFEVCLTVWGLFSGGYNYLQVCKPGLNIPLDAHMVQPEYVSTLVNVFYISPACS